jgi:hypothetical protein
MLRGERHAQGEQNARGSSTLMGSRITWLYIASLHEIEDIFVSGFEFEKQLMLITLMGMLLPPGLDAPPVEGL